MIFYNLHFYSCCSNDHTLDILRNYKQDLDDIFLLTGGSSGTKTLTINVYETGFNIGNLGAGAANAVLVFLILIISALIIIKLSPKE